MDRQKHLNVTVLGAVNLPASDLRGTSDPYCGVITQSGPRPKKMKGKHFGHHKTHAIKKVSFSFSIAFAS
jgi:Ca2+-dependent lipid-binding protein